MTSCRVLPRFLQAIHYRESVSPNLATLRAFHCAWPAAFPFENIEVLLGRPLSIDAGDIADKFFQRRRGGYCFEHNLLFKQVLEEAGFAVTPHLARVLWNGESSAAPPKTHMLLNVTVDGVTYLADVGFGGLSQTQPLRLEEGEQGAYRLERSDADGWRLSVTVSGRQRPVYLFDARDCEPADILVASHFVATWPDSLFRHNLMMARILDGVQVNLLNRRRTVHDQNKQESVAQTREQFRSIVSAFFDDNDVLNDEDLRLLWQKTAGR